MSRPSALRLAGALAGLAPSLVSAQVSAPTPPAPIAITLFGVARDFRESADRGGHPDMELAPADGPGHYLDIVQDVLDQDGKPSFKSTGRLVRSEDADRDGHAILGPRLYLKPQPGDTPGSAPSHGGGAVAGREPFAQWFRDIPAVNTSCNIPITLVRRPDSEVFVYDDDDDPRFGGRGFFVFDRQAPRGARAADHNFYFTYELETTFTRRRSQPQRLAFTSAGDLWVFIDGRLVIDLGGIHPPMSQRLDLDRLAWLEDGRDYQLKVFFAQRHRPESRFRMEIALDNPRPVERPPISALAD